MSQRICFLWKRFGKLNLGIHCGKIVIKLPSLVKTILVPNHRLQTPNEGINQRSLKLWADVTDKITVVKWVSIIWLFGKKIMHLRKSGNLLCQKSSES